MDLLGIVSFFQGKEFLDIKEVGNNKSFSNALFEQMLKSVGWISGEAWCAALVKAVYINCFPFDKAWLSKNLTKGAYSNLQIVSSLNAQGDKKYVAIKKAEPQVGDIAVWQDGTSTRGHTGIVSAVITPTKIKCIEGNTSEAGVREGDGVYEKIRNVSIGTNMGGLMFRGYIRRNFTKQELEKLTWDEDNLAYYMNESIGVAGGSSLSKSQDRLDNVFNNS